MKRLLIVPFLLLPFFYLNSQSKESRGEEVILKQAETEFVRGNFKKAADLYTETLGYGMSPDKLYNLANSYWWMDRKAEALYILLKAESLYPFHNRVNRSLMTARLDIDSRYETPENLTIQKIIFYYSILPEKIWLILTVLIHSIFFFLIIYRLFRSKKLDKSLLVAGIISIVITALPLAVYNYSKNHPVSAVITEKTLYSGQGDFYDPVIEHPLEPGTEFRVLEKRGLWRRVEIDNSIEGWIKDPDSGINL